MRQKKNIDMNRGAALLLVVFMLLFLLFIGRFLWIQVTGKVAGEDVFAIGKQRQTATIKVETQRGTIYDHNGTVLAEDVSKFKLIAKLKPDDNELKRSYISEEEKPSVAKELATILNADESYILERLNQNIKQDSKQVEFGSYGNNLSFDQKQQIEGLNITGLLIQKESQRYYPNGTFASHVLGYLGPDENGEMTGQMGIEKEYNDELKNQDGEMTFKKDRTGTILPKVEPVYTKKPINGDDIYLTIDQRIQSFVEDALSEVEEMYNPERMVVIVSEPKTGKILAMGSRPSFNPNEKNITNYTNYAISNAYEPGSTMKVFTLAAAVNEGVFKGDEYYQSGTYKVPGGTIHDHNYVGWGSVSFLEGVQRSSNVAFSIIAEQQLGFDKLYSYLHAFKFNEPTGIDLPGESVGTILYRYPIEKISTAFGQGTTITPIQQIQAFSAMLNDGKMMKPYVIDRVVNSVTDEVVSETKPTVAGTPITAETAHKVLDILETVISSKVGTGKPFSLAEEGYTVAGKTGQAQIASPQGGYLTGHSNYIFSFIGAVPKEDPQLAIYVAVDRPNLKATDLGSKPVAQIFKSVALNSLQYLKVKPTKEPTGQTTPTDKEGIVVPDFSGMSIDAAKKQAATVGIDLVAVGDGTITQQYPAKGEKVVTKSKVIVKAGGTYKMPDLTGWTMQEVSMLNAVLNIDIHYLGSGYVYNQSINAGVPIKDGDKLVIKLKLPNQVGESPPEAKPEDAGPID